MIADSVKFKGHWCFKNDWCGFDAFKPITVIIGRNNTGKSHLIELVEKLTSKRIGEIELPYSCSGILDEESLRTAFPENRHGGDLGQGSHWESHGRHFVGAPIEWILETRGSIAEIVHCELPKYQPAFNDARKKHLARLATTAVAPVHGLSLRRIAADRDIQPEEADTKLQLAPDGRGATNIIRRYIVASNAEMQEEIIQTTLREALSYIFGQDGEFTGIEVRLHEEENRWEVYVRESGKGLVALSRSGSGLKTVVLVLLNLLVMPRLEGKSEGRYVFAFEELENNLHPALLRRLFSYLADYVTEQRYILFLTTHSNVALDFFGQREDSQIIHVTHNGESASTRTISAHFDHVGLLTELGARPSDLLQANGVIWLEGPSDRIYFNRFIELYSNGEFREGRDYQCAYYGGSNLANSTFNAPEDADDTLTNLLRLNHNIALVCDGDRTAATGAGSRIKGRVSRIKQEVEAIDGAYLWITEAKEIENYIPGEVWGKVYGKTNVTDPETFDRFPTSGFKDEDFVPSKLGRKSFDKMEFAMKAAPHLTMETLLGRFELGGKMTELVARIRTWNQ